MRRPRIIYGAVIVIHAIRGIVVAFGAAVELQAAFYRRAEAVVLRIHGVIREYLVARAHGAGLRHIRDIVAGAGRAGPYRQSENRESTETVLALVVHRELRAHHP